MSVTSVEEMREDRTSTTTRTTKRSQTRYQVIHDVTDADPIESENASAGGNLVPPIGAQHPKDPGRLVLDKSVEINASNPSIHYVTVVYESVTFDIGDLAGNPLARPTKVAWEFEDELVKMYEDVDGKPALNSAGVPFDPAHEDLIFSAVAIISKNVSAVPVSQMVRYGNAVNSDSFMTVSKYQAKCVGMRASDELFENGVKYYRIEFRVKFRKEGFYPVKLLDQGYSELVKVEGGIKQLRPILGPDGTPVSEPVALDGKGRKATEGTKESLIEFKPKQIRVLPFRVLL